jgi:hypothetical protein
VRRDLIAGIIEPFRAAADVVTRADQDGSRPIRAGKEADDITGIVLCTHC